MSELSRQVEPPERDWRKWMSTRIAGLGALIVGVGSLVAMLLLAAGRGRLEMLPPLSYTAGPVVVACGLAITSAVRREPALRLWISGVVAAGAAVISGWVVVIAAVALGLATAFWLVSELAG